MPLGEDAERYRIVLTLPGGATRTAECAAPTYEYGPALQAADGLAAHTTIMAAISQIGTHAASAPALATWSL